MRSLQSPSISGASREVLRIDEDNSKSYNKILIRIIIYMMQITSGYVKSFAISIKLVKTFTVKMPKVR